MRLYHITSPREFARVAAEGFPSEGIAYRFTSARPKPRRGLRVVKIEVAPNADGVEEIRPGVFLVHSFAANAGLHQGKSPSATSVSTIRDGDILTIREAAVHLKTTVDKLRGLSTSGKLPCRRLGATWRYSRRALDEWVKGEASPSPSASPSERRIRAGPACAFVPPKRNEFAGKF